MKQCSVNGLAPLGDGNVLVEHEFSFLVFRVNGLAPLGDGNFVYRKFTPIGLQSSVNGLAPLGDGNFL